MDRRQHKGGAACTAYAYAYACAAALTTLGSLYSIQHYRRRYQRGRIISLRNYIITYHARRRMHSVIQSLLPIWKSNYNISSISESPIQFYPSDVIVFAPPKCGTTWVTHICHQIRTRGREIGFEDQDDVIPWIERLGTQYLEGTYFNDRPNANHVAQPRIFKSHLSWDSRPTTEGSSYKQIWVFRNCVDMMTSTSHFLPSLWGIKPALSEDEMCSFLLENGDVEEALLSLANVWARQKDEGILLLFYENITEDHRCTVETIAKFMNVSLSVKELDRIVEQTTKKGMLRHHGAFACRAQAKNAHRARGIVLDESKLVGKVRRRRNDAMPWTHVCNERDGNRSPESGIASAVQTAWQWNVAKKTGIPSYESMRHIRV